MSDTDVGLSETPSPQRRIVVLEADVRRLTAALAEALTDADKWHDVAHRMHQHVVGAEALLGKTPGERFSARVAALDALDDLARARKVWEEAT